MVKYQAIIVGSGAAAFSTADWLFKYGQKNIVIVTENRLIGTSRNTGSDKQTYYKISMAGDDIDSNQKMATSLFDGGSVDGDIALIEASNSARCFLRLVEYGLPFPTNQYGEYVGYLTDHDSTSRATSIGPYTSKYMTSCLEKKVEENGTPVLDGMQAIRVLKENNAVIGLLVIDSFNQLQTLQSPNIILATGGEASIYRDTVYPVGHSGTTSLGIECGAALHNFQEWQYGMAATKFRWNVSGSYQQVIPKYISVDKFGTSREFLVENYITPDSAYNMVFLKGYQWPFDSQKTEGSSKIDMLVYEELLKGRRVYLDFRSNPSGYCFDNLSEEARKYLNDAGCVDNTPYLRLKKLNSQAIEVFRKNHIDLEKEMLEIAICAQHNNGGLGVDKNWETNVGGLFAVGEVAGTFGIYRPGGSALNSTQVGGLRIAEYLNKKAISIDFLTDMCHYITKETKWINKHISDIDNITQVKCHFEALMSDHVAIYRDYEKITSIFSELQEYIDGKKLLLIQSVKDIKKLYKCWDMIICDYYLCLTIMASINAIGSRGGALAYINKKIVPETTEYRGKITVTTQAGVIFKERKPIPFRFNQFETLLKSNVDSQLKNN